MRVNLTTSSRRNSSMRVAVIPAGIGAVGAMTNWESAHATVDGSAPACFFCALASASSSFTPLSKSK